MILKTVRIRKFRNFIDSGEIAIEDDVTALVGKNESGKSSVLHALFRLLPANEGYERDFNATEDYPRWRLSRDKKGISLESVRPVEAAFAFEDHERSDLGEALGLELPAGAVCRAWRTYDNQLHLSLEAPLPAVLAHLADLHRVEEVDLAGVTGATVADVRAELQSRATSLKEEGESARSSALKKVAAGLQDNSDLIEGVELDEAQRGALTGRLPRFFYFSNYAVLPGEFNLHEIAAKGGASLSSAERTALSLLRFANSNPRDFTEGAFESRRAELEAAAIELTNEVFEFWKQNTQLAVVFADEQRPVGPLQPGQQPQLHRWLNIRLRDDRHGGVSTNFSTRSTGFQWFFSFLAAFSEFENSDPRVVVLLDEPGTSLHGEAQADFLRFIFERLGANQQVLYTTHSQHMVDPARYEKLRAVEDKAVPGKPDLGAVVELISLNSDRETLLPVQAALGYSINQHLILGAYRHLLVEGGADFIYLSEMSRHLQAAGQVGLDPALPMLPVGGADKIPPFVALLARHLDVSVLLDGSRGSSHVRRVLALVGTTGFEDRQLVLCGDVAGVPNGADIEDMFADQDYLKLFNWAYGTSITVTDLPETGERLLARVEKAHGSAFDHGKVARSLAPHRDEFFAGLDPESARRFSVLIAKLNATA